MYSIYFMDFYTFSSGMKLHASFDAGLFKFIMKIALGWHQALELNMVHLMFKGLASTQL